MSEKMDIGFLETKLPKFKGFKKGVAFGQAGISGLSVSLQLHTGIANKEMLKECIRRNKNAANWLVQKIKNSIADAPDSDEHSEPYSPPFSQTGTLKSSIKATPVGAGQKILVGPDLKVSKTVSGGKKVAVGNYAYALEFGYSYKEDKSGKKNKRGKTTVVVLEPRPFMTPALEEGARTVMKIFKTGKSQ